MRRFTTSQRGNVFFALFGAVAFVGVLGAATMSFVKGPLKTSVTVSRLSVAETQMQVASQMAVLQASNLANEGDCDSDGFVEPVEFKVQTDDALMAVNDAGSGGAGGNIPDTLGATKQDPWGRLYAYCVWNSGTNNTVGSVGGCNANGSASENRLSGSPHEYDVVMAIISAGPDRTFQTKCLTFDEADNNDNGVLGDTADEEMVFKPSGSDDIINAYTYAEAATVGGGGLWSIKSSDPGTATIDKSIEFSGGLSMGTQAVVTTCGASTANIMRYNTFTDEIQVCDGAGNWNAAAGGATSAFDDDNSVACDGTTQGQVRYNTTTFLPEFCDGSGWRAFNISATTSPELILSPTSINTMNVDGTDNKDPALCTGGMICGNEYTFTVQNVGATDSDPVAWSLDDDTYFVVSSEDCTGEVLSQMESCAINIRPRTNGNNVFTTRLNVSVNNAPFSIIQGEGAGFGCSPGFAAHGGYYLACSINDGDGDYNLIIMDSGCDGSVSNPACTGTDTSAIVKEWGGPIPYNYDGYICGRDQTTCTNAQQHVNLVTFQQAFGQTLFAVDYCERMDYLGYDDWFLPSWEDYNDHMYPIFSGGNYMGFRNSTYHTSSIADTERAVFFNPYSNFVSQGSRNSELAVRCARRETLPLPSPPTDDDPDDVAITYEVTSTPGGPVLSDVVTVSGIFDPIDVTVSGLGGSSPTILLNGVDVGATTSGVTWGDTLQFQLNAPTIAGDYYDIDIDIGDDSYVFRGYYYSAIVDARAFVTNSTYYGSLGGLVGADLKCTENAEQGEGLPSKWIALLSTDSVNAKDRLPINMGALFDLNGNRIISNGVDDLFDGSLENPFGVTQFRTTVSGDVWSGTKSDGTSNDINCNSWTNGGFIYPSNGVLGNTNSAWITGEPAACNNSSNRIICVEDINDTSDTTANDFEIKYNVQVATSSRQSSETITVGGMSVGATQTVSVTSDGGSPTFTINGGSEVTSGSVENEDELVFYMTAPASDNSNHKMDITVGSETYVWRVWTGDSTGSVVKRVFVRSTDTGGSYGGVAGADAACQSTADGQSLGGTWKAILSGISEADFAINRVGYNWSELQLIDGTTVAYAPNLWEASSVPLLSPISMTESGATLVNRAVHTNTLSSGLAKTTTAQTSDNCNNWTSGSNSVVGTGAGITTLTNDDWINGSRNFRYCQAGQEAHLYCIEQ